MSIVGKVGIGLIFTGLLLLRLEDIIYVTSFCTVLAWRRDLATELTRVSSGFRLTLLFGFFVR